jgi:hypothetical protein
MNFKSRLKAYVGETVTLRFDPRDMAEIRIFHKDRFLCQAICPELAGATVPLREILRARNRRRRELWGVLRDRQSTVDALLSASLRQLGQRNGVDTLPRTMRFRIRQKCLYKHGLVRITFLRMRLGI